VLPDGSIALVDKDAGSYSLAQMEGQPQAMPSQPAAPVPQVQSRDLPPAGNIDQYAVDSGQVPPPNASLDSIVAQARAMEAGGAMPPPNMQGMPAEPTSVPLPDALPPSGAPQMTPLPQPQLIPYPAPTGNMAADQKAREAVDAANTRMQEKATEPLSPKDQAKRKSDFAKLELGVNQLEQDSAIVEGAIDRAIQLIESGEAGGFKSAVGSWVPNSATGELAGVLETVKGSNIINTLQTIRASNPTGGAFGNQTEKESAFVAASKGVLDANQSDLTLRNLKAMKENLPLTLQDRRTALSKTFPDLYQMPSQPSQEQPVKRYKFNPQTGELE
jgi:hypothetical protein